VLVLLVVAFLLASISGNTDLCLKCMCYKKALIQPLYTVNCSHHSLQDTFPDIEQWPEYAQQQETRMAMNFDWNDIRHLKKFPNIPGIVSISLQHNNMVKIEDSAFVQLDNLKALDLSCNQLTGNNDNCYSSQGCSKYTRCFMMYQLMKRMYCQIWQERFKG
jgi:hypothetical protein